MSDDFLIDFWRCFVQMVKLSTGWHLGPIHLANDAVLDHSEGSLGGCLDSDQDLQAPGCRGSGLYGRPETKASSA